MKFCKDHQISILLVTLFLLFSLPLWFGLGYLNTDVECAQGDFCQPPYNSSLISPCVLAGCHQKECTEIKSNQVTCTKMLNQVAFGAILLGTILTTILIICILLYKIPEWFPAIKKYRNCIRWTISCVLIIFAIIYNALLVFTPANFMCHQGIYCSYSKSLSVNDPCFVAKCHAESCVTIIGNDEWKCKSLTLPIGDYFTSLVLIGPAIWIAPIWDAPRVQQSV